jgi:hypothetical protein
MWLRDCPCVEDLSVDFTVRYDELGHSQTFDLVPDGANVVGPNG